MGLKMLKLENSKKYIGYDYKTLIVSRKFESAWVDSYNSFGWELEKSSLAIEKPIWGTLRVLLAPLALLPRSFFKDLVVEHESGNKVELHFKRKRIIQNKNELNRLEFTMESTMNSMEQMERNKTFGASVAAYVTGLLGTVCMTMATLSYLASKISVCVEFAIAGFLGWIFAFVAYFVVKNIKEKKVATEIESKFNEVNNICEQAYLLAMNG